MLAARLFCAQRGLDGVRIIRPCCPGVRAIEVGPRLVPQCYPTSNRDRQFRGRYATRRSHVRRTSPDACSASSFCRLKPHRTPPARSCLTKQSRRRKSFFAQRRGLSLLPDRPFVLDTKWSPVQVADALHSGGEQNETSPALEASSPACRLSIQSLSELIVPLLCCGERCLAWRGPVREGTSAHRPTPQGSTSNPPSPGDDRLLQEKTNRRTQSRRSQGLAAPKQG